MILWTILTLMVAIASVSLTIPLVRKRDAERAARSTTLQVLKAQLADLDAQAEAGALPTEEADGLRNEIKRRILAEGRESEAPARPLGEGQLVKLAFGVVAVVALAATVLYARMGRPELVTHGGGAAAAWS